MIESLAYELKANAVEDGGEFSGMASAFNGVDLVNDTIQPGAFTKSLQKFQKTGRLPPLLWQHDATRPIGRWLAMSETDKGLEVKGRLNLKTQLGAEAHALLKAGDLDALSIGFKTDDFSVDKASGVRTLKEIDLIEVSLVTLPADDSARISSVKAIEDWSPRDFERLLRDAGVSRRAAKAFVAQGYDTAFSRLRDADDEAAELVELIEESTAQLRHIIAKGTADARRDQSGT